MLREPNISGALAYNLYLKRDLMRVAQAFELQRIPWLLLKGLSLADTLYGGIAYRSMVDNDVVVRLADVGRAHTELRRLGFVDREANVLALNLAADFQHPMHYDHAPVQTGLELHWHVHPQELFRSDCEDYFTRAVSIRTRDLVYPTLCADDRFIHLVTHWVQHGLNKPSILEDIGRAWNAQAAPEAELHALDIPTIAERAKRMGAFAAVALALLVLERRGRLAVAVPPALRSTRAQLFLARQWDALRIAAERPLQSVAEHHLRAASLVLLSPRCLWLSMSRELMPSRARLSRIVGRPLSRRGALGVLWTRQRRVIGKWFVR
jgi:hypothetical protein